MDVGNPSNWVRIADLFKADAAEINKLIVGYSYNDEETTEAINKVYAEDNYVVCPHTAIAWKALKEWQAVNGTEATGVFLSTAHSCKFLDVMPADIVAKTEIPAPLKALEGKAKQAVSLPADFAAFKNYLLQNV
jgi:threonine synthase